MEWVVFVLTAVFAIGGGIAVITARLPVHSAIALLVVLAALAVTYLVLAAQFVAALQIIIYAGAIVVLFLFVIMLLQFRTPAGPATKLPRQLAVAVVFSSLYLVILLSAVLAAAGSLQPAPEKFGTAEQIGESLFTTHLLPFELASIILLVGIVAAVVLGGRAAPPGGAG